MTLIDKDTNLLMDTAKRDLSFKRGLSVFVGLAIIFASIWYYVVYPNDKKLDAESKYTVGTLTKYEAVLDGDPMADFFYYVDNKKYKGSFTPGPNWKFSLKSGTRVFVRFYPRDPDIARVDRDNIVSDTIKTIPTSGWTKIP
jgi:hypothetical protein